MIAVKEALSIGRDQLNKKGIVNSLFESKLLIRSILNISNEDLISSPEFFLSESQFKTFQSFLQRRKKSEPIAYILNKKDFWKDSFYVNNSTLIPRPDSEIIIEMVLNLIPNKDKKLKFADLGSSSIDLRIDTSASSRFPRSSKIVPRLECASAKSGLSSIALRVDNSASFPLPRSAKMFPRL